MKKLLLGLILLMTIVNTGFSQNRTITGTVTDDQQAPLPGVTVLIKGTSTGAITNSDGQYTIDVPDENTILIFSYVGSLTEEVVVGSQSTIDVLLMPDIAGLDEVYVIGYGTSLKKNVTTSIAKVNLEDVPTAAVSGVNDLLFGKAAGVQVSQYSSQPGGEIDLSIRGRGNPLIVVDGVVVPTDALEAGVNHQEINNVKRGNLGGVNPNDIESIEILKDASAAIYGVNAGNGVILITTKKGKSGRMNVSYNANKSWLKNMPYIEPLESQEYMELYNRFQEDKYLSDNNMQPFGTETPSGFTPKFSDSAMAANPYNTDWLGYVLRDGSIDNHNININGGTDRIQYYASGGYFNQVGTVQNSDMKRYTGSINLTFKISKVFSLNAKVIGSRSKFNNSVAGWQTGGGGANAYTALQAALAYPRNMPVRDPITGEYTRFELAGNPVAQLDITDKSTNNTLLVNTSLDIDIIPNVLKGKILYGSNMESSFRDFFIPSTTNWFDDYRARASLQQNKRQKQTIESFLTFDKNIADIVSISLLAGYGEYITETFNFGVQAFDMNDQINTTNIDGSPANGFSDKSRYKQRSYITRGTFDILDRYLISAAWRYDGFSQFFPDSKYASFPSVSAGWKISNESFLNSSAIDLLKLRASYGTTGQNLPDGVAYGIYSPEGQVVSFNNGGSQYLPYVLRQIDHPNLTWQKTIMQNIGLDIELFNSRLSASFELFQDDVTNLLRWGSEGRDPLPNTGAANTPALSSIATQPVNGGHQVRKGIDASIEGDIIRNNDFSWNLNVNISHYTYNWVERFEEDDPSTYLNVDDPLRAMYAFETDGFLQLGETPSDYQPENAQMAGAPKFVDQNGDGVLDSADVIIYDQTPKISFGINSIFTYKNFDLSIFLYGQLGSYKQNYNLNWANTNNMLTGSTSGSQGSHDAWSSENPGGTLPGASYTEASLGNIGNTVGWGGDYTITKADFLRARNITLGYTFKFEKLDYISDLRLYADIQNAFIITKYKGADPEIASPNVKGAAAPYPMVRTYSIGLNVNF